MPHEISWYVEKRVISVRIYGELDKDEPAESATQIDEYRVLGTAPLFLLLDFRGVTKHPSDMGYVLRSVRSKISNYGDITWTIFLTGSKLFAFFGAMASKMLGMPMRVCKTPEEVNQLLLHLAPELEPLLPAAQPAEPATTT